MVLSVSAFAQNSKIAEAVRKSDSIRAETLNRCYAMSGYAELPRAEKNRIYDSVKKIVEQEGKT